MMQCAGNLPATTPAIASSLGEAGRQLGQLCVTFARPLSAFTVFSLQLFPFFSLEFSNRYR
jgi:hypothetical protein